MTTKTQCKDTWPLKPTSHSSHSTLDHYFNRPSFHDDITYLPRTLTSVPIRARQVATVQTT